MKQKLCSLLTMVLLLFTLAACQQEEAPAPEEDAAQSETITQEEQAEFLARMEEVYAPAMDHFGLNDADYTCMAGTGLGAQDFLTPEESMGLSSHIVQETGDTVPLYFWDETAQTVHTLDLDKDGTFTHRTFQKAEDPDLTDNDLRNLWVETAEAKVWTPD